MKWEDALEIKQNWTPVQARNDLERLIITGERPADKVVGLACKALDMQIPKKLRVEVDNRHGVLNLFYFCPNCNSFRMKSKRYCSNCGQALNWGETYREFGLKEAEEAWKRSENE